MRPISKRHILPFSIIISLMFTYSGVEVSLWEAFTHLSFNIFFLYNTLIVYAVTYFTYYLHFKTTFPFAKSLLLSLMGLAASLIFEFVVFDHDPEDYVEFFSVSIPFGSFVVVAINIYYGWVKKHHRLQQKLEALTVEVPAVETGDGNSEIWLETSAGKQKLDTKDFLYANVTPAYLEVVTNTKVTKAFSSLKQLAEMLPVSDSFFRLNKQTLSNRKAILSYKSLKDGRLEVMLEGEKPCFVSKNKAASFRKWMED